MPTLTGPEPAEPITLVNRVQSVARAVTGATVTFRVAVFLVIAVVGSSMAPAPWSQMALLSIVGLTVELVRSKR
jgi:hypothetical protein